MATTHVYILTGPSTISEVWSTVYMDKESFLEKQNVSYSTQEEKEDTVFQAYTELAATNYKIPAEIIAKVFHPVSSDGGSTFSKIPTWVYVAGAAAVIFLLMKMKK